MSMLREVFGSRRDAMLATIAFGIIAVVIGLYVWGMRVMLDHLDAGFSVPPAGAVDAGINFEEVRTLLEE
jgi:hypothetical protein